MTEIPEHLLRRAAEARARAEQHPEGALPPEANPDRQMTTPRLDLVLSTNENICSVISAELARDVNRLFDEPINVHTREVYIVEKDEILSRTVSEVSLCGPFVTPAGREIELSLVRYDDDTEARTYLSAFARKDIGFIVGSFVRRQGSQCDYVQLGPEMTDPNALIVTRDDHVSRKDIVEAVRTIIDAADPAVGLADEIERYQIQLGLLDGILGKAYAQAANFRSKSFPGRHEGFSDFVKTLALLDRVSYPSEHMTSRHKNLIRNIEQSRTIKRAFEREKKLVSNALTLDLETARSGDVPGFDSPAIRELLKFVILQQTVAPYLRIRGDSPLITVPDPRIYESKQLLLSQPFLDDCNTLDQVMDRQLGEVNPELEKLLQSVGQLALVGSTVTKIVEDKRIDDNTTADALISVTGTVRSPHETLVRVEAKHDAMDGTPFPVYDEVLSRATKTSLAPEDIDELNIILDLVTKEVTT